MLQVSLSLYPVYLQGFYISYVLNITNFSGWLTTLCFWSCHCPYCLLCSFIKDPKTIHMKIIGKEKALIKGFYFLSSYYVCIFY